MIVFLVVCGVVGFLGSGGAFIGNSFPIEGRPMPLIKRLALSGAILLWPISLVSWIACALIAAVYYAPIAALKVWRIVAKQVEDEAKAVDR